MGFFIMGLVDQAKADIAEITSNIDEWAVVFTFLTPGSTFDNTFDFTFQNGQVTIKGIHSVHHNGFDTEGRRVNTRVASVSISDNMLAATGYPIRDANNEVMLRNHRVAIKYSTGNIREYVIREWFPDETIGLTVCILGDYGTN